MKKSEFKGAAVYVFEQTELGAKEEFEKAIELPDVTQIMGAVLDALSQRNALARQTWAYIAQRVEEMDPSFDASEFGLAYDHLRGHFTPQRKTAGKP